MRDRIVSKIKGIIMLFHVNFLTYFITLILFSSLDCVWLLSTHLMYKKYLAHLLSAHVNWIAIVLFYPLYALGMYLFVIKPFDQDASMVNLFLMGAFFGMVTYGTYDLTNYATLKGWPAVIVIIDMCWGALASGSVSVAVVCCLRWISVK